VHGAAGLLLVRPVDAGITLPPDGGLSVPPEAEPAVLVQLRAHWTHQGGTWALPGGARDSHEDVVTAALREAQEEAGADPSAVHVYAQVRGLDHGDWSYTYVLARAASRLRVHTRNAETAELRWVPLGQVAGLALHPALRQAWPMLAPSIRATPPG
jgi:8-oxo-dGTP diphosphatase